MDPITVVNFFLCIVILALGIVVHRQKKDIISLYVGVAFGLFGVSHLATLLGLALALTAVLIIVRTLAYLIVAFALYKRWKP